MDEWESQPRMQRRLSPQEVVLEKKFACSSVVSERLRNKLHNRFLRLMALFVSDGTPTTFTWSPGFPLSAGGCELSEHKTDQQWLTCDKQLLW